MFERLLEHGEADDSLFFAFEPETRHVFELNDDLYWACLVGKIDYQETREYYEGYDDVKATMGPRRAPDPDEGYNVHGYNPFSFSSTNSLKYSILNSLTSAGLITVIKRCGDDLVVAL